MSRAAEIYAREFDAVFLSLSPRVRGLIDAKIHDLGTWLGGYPHHRLKGRPEYRLRVGAYRVIYEFDQNRNILYLVALGHRREVYRQNRQRLRTPVSIVSSDPDHSRHIKALRNESKTAVTSKTLPLKESSSSRGTAKQSYAKLKG